MQKKRYVSRKRGKNPGRVFRSCQTPRPQGFVLAFVVLLAAAGGLYAQTENDFPAGNFWSLDVGPAWGGFVEYGNAFGLAVEPKLWLSPPLMVGARAAAYYSFEGDAPHPDPAATSDAIPLEFQVYLRWNFLRLGKNINKKVNVFAQGGLGLEATYRGNKNFLDDKTKRRGSVLLDAALGATIPLTERWHIEPQVHGGIPHMVGISLLAGYKFPLPEKTRIQTQSVVEYRDVLRTVPPIEMLKVLRISSIEFILFGPDIASYNLGVDSDGQALNDFVIQSTADFLKEHPDYIVRLEGNANPVTTDPNEAQELMALSTQRANTVATELFRRGVPREQMLVMAYGGTRTVSSEQDEWNRNRRVELIIMNADMGAE